MVDGWSREIATVRVLPKSRQGARCTLASVGRLPMLYNTFNDNGSVRKPRGHAALNKVVVSKGLRIFISCREFKGLNQI